MYLNNTHTHTEYVDAFTPQWWLGERYTVLRHAYIAWILIYLFIYLFYLSSQLLWFVPALRIFINISEFFPFSFVTVRKSVAATWLRHTASQSLVTQHDFLP